MTQRICKATGHTIYTSPKEARQALQGKLRSRRVTVYRCKPHPDHYHIKS